MSEHIFQPLGMKHRTQTWSDNVFVQKQREKEKAWYKWSLLRATNRLLGISSGAGRNICRSRNLPKPSAKELFKGQRLAREFFSATARISTECSRQYTDFGWRSLKTELLGTGNSLGLRQYNARFEVELKPVVPRSIKEWVSFHNMPDLIYGKKKEPQRRLRDFQAGFLPRSAYLSSESPSIFGFPSR